MTYETDSIFWVDVEKVVPNPFQPRREFDQAKLQDLGDSIRMYGMLQPLTVTRREIIGENGAFKTEYELIAGERRLRASKLVGLAQVPVIIRSGEESEHMKLELAIIENLQREDLNAVDRALAFKQLADSFELSHNQIAKKMGRSREYVSNSIRLLQLPETILNALRNGDVADGHARTLLMLNDRPEEQDTLFRETMLKKLSVREVEKLARKVAVDKVRKKNWDVDPEIIAIEKQFTESLGTRVQISKTDYGGKLTIDYFSQEDLGKLLSLVNGQEEENVDGSDDEVPVISHVIAATPLEEVGEDASQITKDSNTEPVLETETVMMPDGAEVVASESYTRHDTLHVESQIEEIPDTEQGQFESVEEVASEGGENSGEIVSEQQPVESESVREMHSAHYDLYNKAENSVESTVDAETSPTDTSNITDEDDTSSKKADEDDIDLYSLKNFSL